ncbi:3,4-dihydroxy-2-butanone-4-phosphate synthase [Halegenticoccus soli]|uniref:3,4-dihydroxy-2-butanone-4-phosphate synthase n=1 Tax=Halegenticoccus soli TaxID=1985678 RepID=UPI001E5A8C38|nr:3,4-dihydroxy-2-butanone-4-phosphate synthase [Halegenticoccus soli]
MARAIDAFRAGDPVLIHDFDDREGETDIVYPAGAVAPADVARLRNDAGGLVCVALSDGVAEAFGLPFLDETIDHPSAANHDLAYDSRSSFSLPVNHRGTFTGVTDEDRALTIAELAAAADAVDGDGGDGYDASDFAAEFRSPGHVNLLRAAPGLLADRRGHTELGLALADAAGLPPAVVVCEMLDDETGKALPKGAARAYARRHGLVYLEGGRLVDELA